MKNNWSKAVNEVNHQRYTIPEGWDTRDQVAEKLECAPDRVADLLKPGIQSGDFERQEFPVWDEKRRLTTRVTCYRVAGETSAPDPIEEVDPKERERVVNAIRNKPEVSDAKIAKNHHSRVSVVRAIRGELAGSR